MHLSPLHFPAATPLAQSKGSEIERSEEDIGAQRRAVYHGRKAEAAGGVGEPDGEDHETAERDGDGRRPWEEPFPSESADDTSTGRQSKDPTQQCGTQLDLTG